MGVPETRSEQLEGVLSWGWGKPSGIRPSRIFVELHVERMGIWTANSFDWSQSVTLPIPGIVLYRFTEYCAAYSAKTHAHARARSVLAGNPCSCQLSRPRDRVYQP